MSEGQAIQIGCPESRVQGALRHGLPVPLGARGTRTQNGWKNTEVISYRCCSVDSPRVPVTRLYYSISGGHGI